MIRMTFVICVFMLSSTVFCEIPIPVENRILRELMVNMIGSLHSKFTKIYSIEINKTADPIDEKFYRGTITFTSYKKRNIRCF